MWIKKRIAKFQKGASLTEMVVVSPALLFFGLSTVQAGLVYHGKTTVNYATFEAARSGAVNHGQVSVMRKELGLRLAPLEGGDGSTERAASAIAQSVLKAANPVNTRLKIISPSIEAFEDWKITDDEGREVIPNSHLRHIHGEMAAAGSASGMTLRDANLLKVEVTHGFELKVPFVNRLVSRAMLELDQNPANATFYAQNMLPIKSVATVRMQSELWKDEVLASHQPPPEAESTIASLTDPVDTTSSFSPIEQSPVCNSNNGLGSGLGILETESYAGGACATTDVAFGGPNGLGGHEC